MRKLHFSFALLIALCTFSYQSKAQCPYPVDGCECIKITMPPDPTICAGASYTHDFTPDIYIPPGVTIESWAWSPAAGVSPGSGSFPMIPGITSFTPGATTMYCIDVKAYGVNMITNGDFHLGPICFNTAYAPYSGGPGNMAGWPGTFAVDINTTPYFGAGMAFADHSSTVGGMPPAYNMLIVDGDLASPSTLLWEETKIPVCPDQDYEFSFWLTNILPGGITHDAQIRVVIDGIPYGLFQATGFLSWQQQVMMYHSPAAGGFIDIQIYDDNIMNNANDFAIDDISMKRLCRAKGCFTINVERPAILGLTRVCVGNSITLTGTPPGGTWSCTPGATIDPMGVLTGTLAGMTIVTYTSPLGCIATSTVNILPNPVNIVGPVNICVGQTASLVGTPSGLTWTYSGPIWPWTGTSNYYGYAPGTALIQYTNTVTGCYDTHTVTVNENPHWLPYYHICQGDVITLTETPPGGTWTSSNTAVATIGSSSGIVTGGMTPGFTTITYTTLAGCSITTRVYVYDCSSGVVVGGGGSLCEGSSRTLIGLPTGGTWSSSNTAVATIDPITGVITTVPGAGGGPVTFTYTVGSITITTTITIIVPETACVSTVYSPMGGYSFDFTTSCPGTATVYFRVYDYTWNLLGNWSYSYTFSGTLNIPYSTIQSLPPAFGFPSCMSAYRVCVYGVWCNGCWWPANCCATVNPGPKAAPEPMSAEEEAEGVISVMPNPNNGTFTVTGMLPEAGKATNATVEVMDMLGKVLYSESTPVDNGVVNKNVTLDGSVANGVYVIRVTNGGSSHVMRFVLNR